MVRHSVAVSSSIAVAVAVFFSIAVAVATAVAGDGLHLCPCLVLPRLRRRLLLHLRPSIPPLLSFIFFALRTLQPASPFSAPIGVVSSPSAVQRLLSLRRLLLSPSHIIVVSSPTLCSIVFVSSPLPSITSSKHPIAVISCLGSPISPLHSPCKAKTILGFEVVIDILMAQKSEPEIDDELFDEVYGKAYTGPPGSTVNNAQERANSNKRPHAGGNANDEDNDDDEPHDPNAVPTDFTSREAKAWVARAKATERNWKKRKEEEMICKICGESGHFTQGCPSTLGASRKSQDLFQRVPARDKHVRALFTEKVIQKIEKDAGCKFRMEEKFIIISAKDNSSLTKGIDAVHKVIQDEEKAKAGGGSSSQRTQSRSPDRSPAGPQLRRSESQRSHSHSSPRRAPHFQPKAFKQERFDEDLLREDLKQLSRRSPQGRDSIQYVYGTHIKLVNPGSKLVYSMRFSYANNGGRGHAGRSKSPPRPGFAGSSFGSFDSYTQNTGMQKNDNWDSERRGVDAHSSRKYEFPGYPQTLEELEMEFKREAMEFGRIRDKEEDEENYKHRETIRELRETYMKKLAILRGMHAKQWEEFRELNIQRQQRAQHLPPTGYDGYSLPNYPDIDRSSANPHFMGANVPSDSRSRYSYPVDNYTSSRPHDSYGYEWWPYQLEEQLGNPGLGGTGSYDDRSRRVLGWLKWEEMQKLGNEYRLEMANAVKIDPCACEVGPFGLVLRDFVLEKPLDMARCNWEAKVLTERQIHYACIDDYAPHRIAACLRCAS
ncbi:hypothetical protein ACLOJK_026584 [Asimina triloba]